MVNCDAGCPKGGDEIGLHGTNNPCASCPHVKPENTRDEAWLPDPWTGISAAWYPP